MEDSQKLKPKIRPLEQLVFDGWRLYSENLLLFFKIVIWTWLPASFIVAYRDQNLEEISAVEIATQIVSCILFIVGILTGIAVIHALKKRDLQEEVKIKESYLIGKNRFWRYIGVNILSGLIVFLGLLFFVIPGIIFSIWLAFVEYALVLENKKVIECLKRSRELVRGNWWSIFWRFLIIGLVFTMFAIVLAVPAFFAHWILHGIISALIVFLSIWPMSCAYLIYKDLSFKK